MTTIVTILTQGYADWETALLNAAARTHLGVDTRFATPDGQPVTSAGGLQVIPHMSVSQIDPTDIDAVIVNGGPVWSAPDAPDIASILHATFAAGKTVAAICDGTLALAKAGLLDTVRHTSNSPDNLAPTRYRGADHYQNQPAAVLDGRIVTAPGTAPVSFMAAVLQTLGLRNEGVDFYIGLYRAEHEALAALQR